MGLRHGPDSYGRQQWGILHNGGNSCNGFTVPNDISIIGYDDSIYARDLGLTTVRQTPVEMAQEAAQRWNA